ncbi:MAG TPA: glycoside hydrolase family 2 TIM barrel-domain containing protein [Tepidisphaeraceae bacterium]
MIRRRHFLIAMLVMLDCALASGQSQNQSQRQYLSRKGNDDTVQWEFFCSQGDHSGEWTKIAVPSCWEMEGFGRLTYGKDWPRATEQGKYRHQFMVPAAWQSQRVFLVFDGVMTDTQASVNGQSAGPKHQGAFYRFKYDITPLLKFDGQQNLLEVTVDKDSANASVNRAERSGDYWNFAGIFRPVYLEAVPQQHIDRVAIDARADGRFAIDVYLPANTSADVVETQIVDSTGTPVGQPFSQKLGEDHAHVKLESQIDSPKTWTAETPNLYRARVRLKQGETVLHEIEQRFGFRTIEVRKGDGVYVNGLRVMLKGSDRHSFWPESGRCTSEKISRMDVALMKEMNMNAVRMSHYPPDEHFLEVCDEQGLYVLDELAGWHAAYDTEIGRQLIGEMITRDVNHPSILFWDNGNEGGWNFELDDDFAKWDPQKRAVLHPWQLFRDVTTAHYPSYDRTKALCAGPDVFMPTEFLHGLFDGGIGAGLEEYWKVMRASKVCAGGFLWAFLDEAVKRKDSGRMDTNGNAAPDGIVGPYRQKEGSFYTVKEVWSPVVVARSGNELNFDVDNSYDFTNTDQCRFTWQLRRFRTPDDHEAGFVLISEGTLPAPSIAPHERGTIKLDPPAQLSEADALAMRVDDPNGRELWTCVWPLRETNVVPAAAGDTQAPTVKEDDDAIEVTSKDLIVRFSKQTGFATSFTRGGQTYSLANGPRLAVGESKLEKLMHHADGANYVIEASYSGEMTSARWRIRPDGWMELEYAYHPKAGAYDYLGVSFDLPEQDVRQMTWLGEGPFRVWKNRMPGGTLNVWQNSYNNTMTGYSDWIYPEFKGYYAGVRWMKLQTTAGSIVIALEDPSLFVQVLRPQFPGNPKPAATTQDSLSGQAWATFPNAGLSVLHAIPPIGSKFRPASSTGPQGQRTRAQGDYKAKVWLRFGE